MEYQTWSGQTVVLSFVLICFLNLQKPTAFSNPRFPQNNGKAERAVQISKNLLKKSNDPYLAMLSYCSTPLQNGYSPAELFMGHKLRTTLPSLPNILKPN